MARFLVRQQIEETFRQQKSRVFAQKELLQLIDDHLELWIPAPSVQSEQLPLLVKSDQVWDLGHITQRGVLNRLVQEKVLKKIQLPFPHRAYTRFAFGAFSIFELLQTLDQDAYFTHYTAMQLHGLTEQVPKNVYLNVEQPATGGSGELSQERIDRAFKGKPRITGNIIEYEGLRLFKLNGMNTARLGVIPITVHETSVEISVTDIERTLIDIAVRPMYAGGVSEVAKAYAAAAAQCSIPKLVQYLKQLGYTYPYHQAIGFYLERSGAYSPEQIDHLASIPTSFDFYIAYQMRNMDYNSRWKLFVPKGF